MQVHKIFYLYLLSYLSYLLQYLDINIFCLLKQNKIKLWDKKVYFLTYNVDKADFILLIQKTR